MKRWLVILKPITHESKIRVALKHIVAVSRKDAEEAAIQLMKMPNWQVETCNEIVTERS